MKKRFAAAGMILTAVLLLAGCSALQGLGLGTDEPEPEPIENGTTAGNILNFGFGVQVGDDLVFTYTAGSAYEYGSVVRSNPETGENSLVRTDGGLYMSVADDMLYYCREDGIYRAPIGPGQAEQLTQGKAKQLQISGGAMYYIEDDVILSAKLDGGETDFMPVENADWLNVYEGRIYYVDTGSGQICTAGLDGRGAGVFLEQKARMLIAANEMLYYIDDESGYIMRAGLDEKEPAKVVAHICSGFNVNASGIYYTREIDGAGACCNAGPDGVQETVIEEFGQSEWHAACMWNEGALVVRVEDLAGLR